MGSVFCGAYTGKTFLAGYVVEGENECMDYKETILIVDDSALNRMVLIEILGKEDYTFLEAENGQQAVELLDCHPEVDLLLLDITMPRIAIPSSNAPMTWGPATTSPGPSMPAWSAAG